MNDNQSDRLGQATQAFRDASVPSAPPAQLMHQTIAAMRRVEHAPRAMFMRVAAMIVIGLTLGGFALFWAGSSQSIAMAQVAAKARQTQSVEYTMREKSSPEYERMLVRGGEWVRMESFTDGVDQPTTIGVINLKTGQVLGLNPAKKKAFKMNQVPRLFDFYAWLRSLASGSEQKIAERDNIDGRSVMGFEVTHPTPDFLTELNKPRTTMKSKVWVDLETRLPVRVEFADPEGNQVVINDIHFDLPADQISDARFSMMVPEGYTVEDMGGLLASKLQPPPTTQEARDQLTITPKVGIGQLRFGDSKKVITDLLGPPEDGTDRDLRYPSRGIALLVDPRVGLLNIMAYSRAYAPIFNMNDFSGATDRGIKLGATRDQIEAAYGKAETVESAGDLLVLRYDSLSGWFSMHDGKLVQVFFTMPRDQLRTRIDAYRASTQPATQP